MKLMLDLATSLIKMTDCTLDELGLALGSCVRGLFHHHNAQKSLGTQPVTYAIGTEKFLGRIHR
jgi:hypothetical protein